jgi:hypothetical protein
LKSWRVEELKRERSRTGFKSIHFRLSTFDSVAITDPVSKVGELESWKVVEEKVERDLKVFAFDFRLSTQSPSPIR